MTLTRKDLDQVTTIVNNCFETYVKPLHEWSLTVDAKLETLDYIKNKMGRFTEDTEDKVQKNEHLIGQYYHHYKDDFRKLEKRVHRLELAAA